MTRSHVLALVQAGGAGGRMDGLTRERAKPTLPFAGVFQLVDFPLSNLANSGITDVWLSVQCRGAGLGEEVANGRPWDLDRNRGGLRLLMPQEGTGATDEEGFGKGNADELYRFRDQVVAAGPDELVVLSADHVYRFDVMDAVDTHRRTGAECTIVTTSIPIEEASDHATVEADDQGKVTGQGVLGDVDWPILGHQQQRPAARVLDGGQISDSLVSPGSRVAGTVVRSVLGPGVVVEEGATVRDSVVFRDTRIRSGSRLDWAVVDQDCAVGPDAEVGSADIDPDDPDTIVLIGRRSTVGRHVTIGQGSRLEPGTTA